jgi:hypothetical protein
MSLSRRLQRKKQQREEKEAQGPKGQDHRKLPVGKLISPPVKGDFLCLPLFGWVAIREKADTPLVMLVVTLIRSTEDPTPRGTLQIELPVWPETERATVAALARFGWDGRIWPKEDGWPEGDETDSQNLIELMSQAKLRNTMTFPPDDRGVACQSVTVARARGPFLMPPLEVPEGDVDPFLLERLQALCEDPKPFYPIMQARRPMPAAIERLDPDAGVQ